MINTVVDLM